LTEVSKWLDFKKARLYILNGTDLEPCPLSPATIASQNTSFGKHFVKDILV